MSTNGITSATLRSILSLTEKRERIQDELNAIESQIAALYSGGTVPKTRGRKPGKAVAASVTSAPAKKVKAGKRGKRGALKETVLEALKSAGSAGVSVKDLASSIGIKNQNLHVWFATTGKTIKGLKKTGPGKYTLAA